MSKKFSEQEMVDNFIKKMSQSLNSFKYVEQIKILPNIIDFAYYDYLKDSLIGIEFKKYDWKKVIYQANLVSKRFNKTYICLIKPIMEKTSEKIINICKKLGIGVIFYNSKTEDFEWVLSSKINSNITQIIYKYNLTLEQYFKKLYGHEKELREKKHE